MVSRGTLARRLEAVSDFDDPSPELEQYLTPPEIAAHILHVAALQGDLTGKTVVDLGTGTGMLAIGASIGQPDRVLALDVDPTALGLARRNEARVRTDLEPAVDWIRGDVGRHPLTLSEATVVSNPPFGAQRGNRHADRPFLEAACDLASVSYTIHNEGSQAFVESFATDHGGTVTHAFRATFSLENQFAFHEDERRELEAEVFRIEW